MSAPHSKTKPRVIQSYTLDPDLCKDLKKVAEEENRSVSNLVEVILSKWVKEREAK